MSPLIRGYISVIENLFHLLLPSLNSDFAILLWLHYTMNTPETQSPIDTTDIPIDNIGNRKTLRKKGSAFNE